MVPSKNRGFSPPLITDQIMIATNLLDVLHIPRLLAEFSLGTHSRTELSIVNIPISQMEILKLEGKPAFSINPC